MQPTKYANAVLSRDKVLAIPPNSCVGQAAKLLLIVKRKQALQSILIVILYSRLGDKASMGCFKVTTLTRGKGVGPGLAVLEGLRALTCRRLIRTVCEGI